MRLSLHDVSVRLGPRLAVQGIELALEGGALVGILGPNGAGKTTLLRAMAGLLPASAGAVRLDGRPLAAIAPAERARRLAYLPQERECRWPIRVADLVALGTGGGAGPAAVLAETELAEFAARPMDELSGGERARALMARALAGGPAVLLADEPLAGLDPGHQLDLLALLRARTQAGLLAVVVAHDLALLPRFADRLVMLSAGRVIADGQPDAVLADPAVAAAYGVQLALGRIGARPYALPAARAGGPHAG